ncbi:DUF1254 domain-containing protein [Halomonas sp. CKK8]|uniref:DUF1254 domain-containing protein n=1 Tax=Halomonas sp. CKK8 TaxID=3036127 RepID=UPI00241577BF|nr:DUF1254 domain-containing protein [Halomonas sp. CKK8]WFM72434.1 DUF1254 domain-containing protein [Halomonas sp. CKK8]
MTIRESLTRLITLGCITALLALPQVQAHAQDKISAAEARAIAKEAYIYGYPMVDGYRIQYGYFVDKTDPEYKGQWNEIHNIPRVYTPEDKAVQTPNSDTPYSFIGADLRAEPLVLTVPEIPEGRYYSIQFIDAYTFNFAYAGSRTTGNEAGSIMLAGPNWKGEKPQGIKKVIQSETEINVLIYRTQLFDPSDIDNVKKIQAGYKVEPLSSFLGTAEPTPAPDIDYIKPISQEEQKSSLEVFNILNFILQFSPTVPSEKELMERFAKIGIGAGKTFDPKNLSPEMKKAFEEGIVDAWNEFADGAKLLAEGKITAGDVFGTRASMKNNYFYRWLATIGIWGNSKQEAMYPIYFTDASGQKLNGANRYTLHFPKGKLPPAHAFWSLTMYQLPESLLVDNPIDRYLINSPMLPDMKMDADGGLTLYIQHESPGKDMESNWLPAPKGPFSSYLRIYWPKPDALTGKWNPPPVKQVP